MIIELRKSSDIRWLLCSDYQNVHLDHGQTVGNRAEENMCSLACTEMSLSWPTTQTNILLTSKPAPSAAQAHFTIVPQEISCISFTQVLHGCSSMAFSSFILDLHWTVTYSPDAVNGAEAAKAPSVLWLTGSPPHAWATSTSPGHVCSAGWGTAQARAHSWQTSSLFWGQKLCLACLTWGAGPCRFPLYW